MGWYSWKVDTRKIQEGEKKYYVLVGCTYTFAKHRGENICHQNHAISSPAVWSSLPSDTALLSQPTSRLDIYHLEPLHVDLHHVKSLC